MKTETPLTDKDYVLQKIGDYKYAWTVAEIPEIQNPQTPFGMLKVKAIVDGYEIPHTHLMPMGNGKLGLPIKAAIRKRIKKQAGDTVHITLYKNKTPFTIPDELLLCMQYEEGITEKFHACTPSQQKAFIHWIYSAKTEQTKADRIAQMIIKLQNNDRL